MMVTMTQLFYMDEHERDKVMSIGNPVPGGYEIPSRSGLGDLVAVAIKPVARVIDSIVGTKLRDCGGCAKRRELLNDLVPFNTHKP